MRVVGLAVGMFVEGLAVGLLVVGKLDGFGNVGLAVGMLVTGLAVGLLVVGMLDGFLDDVGLEVGMRNVGLVVRHKLTLNSNSAISVAFQIVYFFKVRPSLSMSDTVEFDRRKAC